MRTEDYALMLLTTYGEVLSRFEALKLRGESKWRAKCPAHDDRHPSLDIGISQRTGQLLIKCHAGCPLPAVLQAVGLTMRDLFPDMDERDKESPSHDRPKRRIVKTYDYRDEVGTLLYQVCRFEPKSFAQRHPVGTNKDGSVKWEWGLNGVRRVLYRLPELLADPRQPVLVVEGEKDADALADLGLVATTNCGGTGMGWLAEYSQSLGGRRCVVIPDNDRPGLEHAWTVAGSLIWHGAESVRLIHLGGGAVKDVSDWLAVKGNGRAELVSLIRATPEWQRAGKVA